MNNIYILFLLLFCILIDAAQAGNIHGTVTDYRDDTLDSVYVSVQQAGGSTYTESDGSFHLESLEKGTYEITFSKHDFISNTITIHYAGTDTSLTIQMEPAIQELGHLTVVATAAPSRLDEVSRTVSVKNEEDLKHTHSQSLGDALKKMPGVQLAEQGPNVTKPVIRGMTNQRIVLVRDGSRHEGQQWSNHHTPEVDISDASSIEVLRGPGSLLYGSGALGGVVLVKSPPVITTEDGAKQLGTDATYQYFTNSQQNAGHLGIHGAWLWGAWRIDLSGRDAPFFAVPGNHHFLVKQAAGEVSDSVTTEFAGFRQYNVRLMTGVRNDNIELSMTGTHYWEEQQLIGEGHWHNSGGPGGGPWYHVGEPIQSPTLHQKLQLNGKIYLGENSFNFDIAGQHDHRRGIPGSVGVQVDLENYYATFNGQWNYGFNPKFPGTIGIGISRKNDRTDGIEVLIPDYNTTDGGLFFLQELRLSEKFKASFGIRGDVRDYRIFPTQMTEGFKPYLPATLRGVTTDSIPSLIVEGTDRGAVPSFSLGFSWKPLAPSFSVAANFGTGFRLPEPNELAILGAHHGSYEYLVGLAVSNPEQGYVKIDEINSFREKAYNTDLILRFAQKPFTAECAFFYNRLVDYIYAKPTGEFIWLSAISALPVKEYVQTDAHIYGAEFSGMATPLPPLSLEFGADITIGEILDKVTDSDEDGTIEKWLPGIQPPRLMLGILMEMPTGRIKWIRRSGLSFGAESFFAQKRLAEFENVLRKDSQGNNVLFPSKGYVLFNAGAETEVEFFSRMFSISLEAKNLFNTRYTSHLSNYKGIALNPGFDFSVKVIAEL